MQFAHATPWSSCGTAVALALVDAAAAVPELLVVGAAATCGVLLLEPQPDAVATSARATVKILSTGIDVSSMTRPGLLPALSPSQAPAAFPDR
jgi:hypothetical protein